ncbi:MAG: hypothetical protein NDI61_04815 [Bdellovibrionaceae bacterium]|nr:hypothetical protein [Pseudobdellovibrionaceae bacterium]
MTAVADAKPMWVEVTDAESQAWRYQCLSEFLSRAGVDTAFESVHGERETLAEAIADVRRKGVRRMRFGGTLADRVPSLTDNSTSLMLTLKAADALEIDAQGRMWPSNVLQDGFMRMVAHDLRDLDLGAGAFVVGATADARACVASLVRVGFRRVNLTDADEEKALKLLAEFRSAYFNVQFQFTRRLLVTQLPGVHSIAVNTIRLQDDPTHLNELFYFNFLKSGGIWVELPLGSGNDDLLNEARSAGAQVQPGLNLAAYCDQSWVESSFRVKLDTVSYRDELARRMGSASSS